MASFETADGVVQVLGPMDEAARSVVTPEAVSFVAALVKTHGGRVRELLERRREAQARYDAGQPPRFLPETEEIRRSEWTVAPAPRDLQDRRVEITGPVSRKMVINALNSGASTFMADFEDATSPTWKNLMEGQVNLRDAVAGTIGFTDPDSGKEYRLVDRPATLLVRPRGWHLFEEHVTLDGEPVPGGIVDFGFFFFHNARALLHKGSGPYFYLPKLQSHIEARLWNDIFLQAQATLDLPRGTIKATVLVETLPATFELNEILWELREHSAGLNCGRWDYIFSYIKTFRAHPGHLVPDRGQVTMSQPFMRAYTQLVVKTCHRRGAHAMGGMAAQIPIKGDPSANEAALAQVRADKTREVTDGHDGTWVAHPALVPLAREIFDAHMPGPNQIHRTRKDFHTTEEDLIRVPAGTRTEEGLRHNIRVGVQYIAAWLGGNGCVPLYNLMEDAATAEISRTQVWQWMRHGATLEDGRLVDRDLFERLMREETALLIQAADGNEAPRIDEAARLFVELATAWPLPDFLTLAAYTRIKTLAA